MLWLAPSSRAVEPLAQQYVVVHHVRDLNDPKQAVCVGTPDIIRLPSGRLIASMELWLKRPTSSDEGGFDYPNHCKIKVSDDDGKTWNQVSTNGITWGSLFYVKDALYMIGNDPHKRDIRIIRSTDRGESWSEPATLFSDSRYHGSATPVHVKGGFAYRAFEDLDRGSASLVVAGDLSKDLLDPGTWRMSNKVEPPRDTPSLSRNASTKKDVRDSGGNWFLEGNVVEIRGELYVLLRTSIDVQLTAGMTSVCKLADEVSLSAILSHAGRPEQIQDHLRRQFRFVLDLHVDRSRSLSGSNTACRTWLRRQSRQLTPDSDPQLQYRWTQLVSGRLRRDEQESTGVVSLCLFGCRWRRPAGALAEQYRRGHRIQRLHMANGGHNGQSETAV